MDERMLNIASRFAIEGEIEIIKPLGEGFINDTFVVKTKGSTPNYILQRKNHAIFPDVPGMMDNIVKVTTHLKEKIAAAGGDPRREALTVTPKPTASTIGRMLMATIGLYVSLLRAL